ncbi:MAG: hypothetical protein ABR976_07730 [Terracidiphilus sp.]|jgi:hypothetical protein
MEHPYGWTWVEAQVTQTIELWNTCAQRGLPLSPQYTLREQRKREKAYDQGLRAVQREARHAPRTVAERRIVHQRIVALFPRFAATALGLEDEAQQLLTNNFLPVGTQLARWARRFDPTLSIEDTIQACRNAWTACGLQALLGQPMELTPSILAYSLLYPYTDNHLDHPDLSTAEKLHFSERFRQRLCGQRLPASNFHEADVWTMVALIEEQYPRPLYPQVYDALLAIHRGQEQSLSQLKTTVPNGVLLNVDEILRISCAKGGTSVLADACLAQPWLTDSEIRFSFDWGVLLQLGDDLQDVREDMRRGSVTLFTRAAAQGQPLDSLVLQLLHFSHHIADRMDRLPNGSSSLKDLLRLSWRSLILMAVANAPDFFSPAFLAELESRSAFRFDFLRARNQKLTGRQSLYEFVFDAFVDSEIPDCAVRVPTESFNASHIEKNLQLRALSASFA